VSVVQRKRACRCGLDDLSKATVLPGSSNHTHILLQGTSQPRNTRAIAKAIDSVSANPRARNAQTRASHDSRAFAIWRRKARCTGRGREDGDCQWRSACRACRCHGGRWLPRECIRFLGLSWELRFLPGGSTWMERRARARPCANRRCRRRLDQVLLATPLPF